VILRPLTGRSVEHVTVLGKQAAHPAQQRCVLRPGQAGIGLQQHLGGLLGLLEHPHIPRQIGDAQLGQAVLPLADRHNEAAHELAKQLKAAGGRIEVYDQNEPMRVKIAKAQSQKIPYMVVLGDKEIENGTVSVRERHEGDLGAWPVEQLVEKLREAAL